MVKRALRNRYVIIFVIFIVWLTFFDENNLFQQADMSKDIRDMEKERDYYISEIRTLQKQKEQLTSDMDQLEKYAREKYLMKKPDEVLFIIEDE